MSKVVNDSWTLPSPASPVRSRAPKVIRYATVWLAVTSALLVLMPTQAPVTLIEHTGSAGVSCTNAPTHDTAALLAAINGAATGGTVTIAAGACALNGNLPIRRAVSIDGAGPQATFLVQHARSNIFQITAPGVTVENVNLDTATYNPGPGKPGDPEPAVLFSARSHTTIRNVTAEAGSGYGMRITGPAPCDTHQTIGTVVDTVTITNSGRGGFAALDIDCTNGAQLRNIVIHGDYVALYHDENVSLTNETYTPDAKTCQAPWYVTGPAHNININQVQSSGGHGIIKGPTSNIVLSGQAAIRGC
jgi:hypothetical protein